jgi:hypothetical protein
MTNAEPKTQTPRWKEEVGCTVGQRILKPPEQENYRRDNRQLLNVAVGNIKSLVPPCGDAISSVSQAGERAGRQIASKRVQIALIQFDSLGFGRIRGPIRSQSIGRPAERGNALRVSAP